MNITQNSQTKKRKEELFIPAQVATTISKHFLLLDTSLLIGLQDEVFRPLFDLLLAQECNLITTDYCLLEFLKFSYSDSLYIKKQETLENLGLIILPPADLKSFMKDAIAINKQAKISLADLSLIAACYKYKHIDKFMLVTADTGDFPTDIFTRELIVSLVKDISVQSIIFTKLIKEEAEIRTKRFEEVKEEIPEVV